LATLSSSHASTLIPSNDGGFADRTRAKVRAPLHLADQPRRAVERSDPTVEGIA
jgi:hypothetical protein